MCGSLYTIQLCLTDNKLIEGGVGAKKKQKTKSKTKSIDKINDNRKMTKCCFWKVTKLQNYRRTLCSLILNLYLLSVCFLTLTRASLIIFSAKRVCIRNWDLAEHEAPEQQRQRMAKEFLLFWN